MYTLIAVAVVGVIAGKVLDHLKGALNGEESKLVRIFCLVDALCVLAVMVGFWCMVWPVVVR